MHKTIQADVPFIGYDFEETCPHCDSSIPIIVDDDCYDYEVTCPVCGKPMMLCSLCHWDAEDNGEPFRCDWNEVTGCYRKRKEV